MSKQLAGGDTYGPITPVQLFAGEKEVVTTHDNVAVSQTLAKYQVVAKNATGDLVAHDPEATDGTEKAVGIMAVAVTTNVTAKQSAPYYVSGFFNHEVLVWADETVTLADRKAAFVGTEIQIGTLYGAA